MNARFSLLLVLAFLVGGALVLWLKPQPPPPAPAPVPAQEEAVPAPEPTPGKGKFTILAASWQPAFCEGAPEKPECTSLGPNRFDADHFALHGLWPQDEYCGVSETQKQRDKDGRWTQLPPVELDPATSAILAEVMPGTRSQLDRHEWIRHGTCFGGDQASYFSTAVLLLGALNGSAVRDLFAERIGKHVSQEEIRAAFDKSFGAGAGERVRVSCKEDGPRRLITELTIGLYGDPAASPNLGRLMLAANPTKGGCPGGIVDPTGLQ